MQELSAFRQRRPALGERRLTPTEATGRAERSVVAGEHGRRDYWLRRLLALADGLGIMAGLLVGALAAGGSNLSDELLWGALALPAWLVLFKAYGLYDRDAKRVSHTTIDDLPWLFHALLVGGLLFWLYYKVGPARQLVLVEVAAFGAGAGLSILGLRSAVRRLTRRVLGPERVLLVGDIQTLNLVSKMRAHPEYGLEPVGVVSSNGKLDKVPVLPVVADVGGLDLEQLIERHRIDRIVLSHNEISEPEMLEVIRECRVLGVKISILPQLFDVMGPSVEVDDVEGVTVLGINPPVLPRSSRFLKRSLDLALSASVLVLATPLLALIAVAIKLDSRGPVFFRQERIGKGGHRFVLIKFRTMVQEADQLRGELLAHSVDPQWLKLDHDPRITRVGRILRLSSLDELPQLWNALKGEMSLVGLLDLIDAEDRQVDGWARRRLDLTPGITGLWQVLGRTDIPFAEMMKLDYLYVTNWSLWGDIRLIWRTLPVVLARRGAN
jgi:exopolysaccharide biosynthesis polyprenyl glycosylphosphotransferase